jgi:hypothetical protein
VGRQRLLANVGDPADDALLLRLPAVTALTPEEIEHALTPAIRATLEPGA